MKKLFAYLFGNNKRIEKLEAELLELRKEYKILKDDTIETKQDLAETRETMANLLMATEYIYEEHEKLKASVMKLDKILSGIARYFHINILDPNDFN